jgi:hypothetical protein
MITLAMVVLDVLGDRAPELALAEGHHPTEAFLRDRAYARRNVCHEVRRPGTGDTPRAFNIRAIVERPTPWPRFFSAAYRASGDSASR